MAALSTLLWVFVFVALILGMEQASGRTVGKSNPSGSPGWGQFDPWAEQREDHSPFFLYIEDLLLLKIALGPLPASVAALDETACSTSQSPSGQAVLMRLLFLSLHGYVLSTWLLSFAASFALPEGSSQLNIHHVYPYLLFLAK